MSLDIYLIKDNKEVYSANITHNLTTMAGKCGVYECLWRSPEGSTAVDLIQPLSMALRMLINEEKYRKYDSSNGWGVYENFVPFIEKLLLNCIRYPDALIEVSV